MALPKLVLVAGPPGSGKTTLATRLGELLPAPVLLKDAIKEGISLTEGARATYGGSIAQRTFDALYRCADVLLTNGCTLVVEAAFHREWFEKETEQFHGRADMRLVMCRVPIGLAASRYEERAAGGDVRRLAHPDAVVIDEMRAGTFSWSAYELGSTRLPSLVVDTTNGYDPSLEQILAFVRDPREAS